MSWGLILAPIDAAVQTLSAWWVTIYPGISGLPPIRVAYKQLPPHIRAGALKNLYAIRADEAITVTVEAISPDKRYFELRGGAYELRDARTQAVVATGPAVVAGKRLSWLASGLAVGIYDVHFDLITDGDRVTSLPVRLLVRPAAPPP